MKILFAGIIARYPVGGVTWCSLMYLLGLRALGHEVFYIEDTGECVYDPVQNTRSTDPSYGTSYIHQALEPFGLGDRWNGSYRQRRLPLFYLVGMARKGKRAAVPLCRSDEQPVDTFGTASSDRETGTCMGMRGHGDL